MFFSDCLNSIILLLPCSLITFSSSFISLRVFSTFLTIFFLSFLPIFSSFLLFYCPIIFSFFINSVFSFSFYIISSLFLLMSIYFFIVLPSPFLSVFSPFFSRIFALPFSQNALSTIVSFSSSYLLFTIFLPS